MNEFNLSDSIVDDPRSEHIGYIHVGWVKEFIELLKDKIKNWDCSKDGTFHLVNLFYKIDKLAGEKLI